MAATATVEGAFGYGMTQGYACCYAPLNFSAAVPIAFSTLHGQTTTTDEHCCLSSGDDIEGARGEWKNGAETQTTWQVVADSEDPTLVGTLNCFAYIALSGGPDDYLDLCCPSGLNSDIQFGGCEYACCATSGIQVLVEVGQTFISGSRAGGIGWQVGGTIGTSTAANPANPPIAYGPFLYPNGFNVMVTGTQVATPGAQFDIDTAVCGRVVSARWAEATDGPPQTMWSFVATGFATVYAERPED